MSTDRPQGPRPIPEEERKFGMSLSADLALDPDRDHDVYVVWDQEQSDGTELAAAVSEITGEDARMHVGRIISLTVSPPDVRAQLVDIAAHAEVVSIEASQPVRIPTIQESHFA